MTVKELRAHVKNRHRAATKKLSRMRRVNRVRDTSDIDPRRDLGKVDRYNKAQLKSYLDTLNQFNSRSVGYYGNARGEKISRKAWAAYKASEKAYNDYVGAYNKRFDKYVSSNFGIQPSERAAHRAKPRGSKYRDVDTPDPVYRKPYMFMGSDEAVIEVGNRLRHRASDEGQKERRDEMFRRVRLALETMGAEEALKKLDEFTDDQLEFFIDFSGKQLGELWIIYEGFRHMNDDGSFPDPLKFMEEDVIFADARIVEAMDEVLEVMPPRMSRLRKK